MADKWYGHELFLRVQKFKQTAALARPLLSLMMMHGFIREDIPTENPFSWQQR